MATIRNNLSAKVYNYMKGNEQKSIVIMNGFNLNIPEDDIEALKQHPIFKLDYENETMEILNREPAKTAELEGFRVMDSKRTGEPLPVFDTPKSTIVPENPKPEEKLPLLTVVQLKEYEGIGDGYAAKIISRQPEGGYASFGELKGANSDLTKLKEDHWVEIEKAIKK